MNWLYCHLWYFPLMRLTHRFNWHHMRVSYPDGDKMLWCHWCGAKYIETLHPHRMPSESDWAGTCEAAINKF